MFKKDFVIRALVSFALVLSVHPAYSQNNLLENQWKLDTETSSLNFQSVKNGSKVETSSFASFEGSVDRSGLATIRVQLDSVDTAVDLRNVRMRFLFFETFRFPTATVTSSLTADILDKLSTNKRIKQAIEFELDLHGVKKTLVADTIMTLFAEDQISITSSSPVSVLAEDFSLMEGILKLQDTANVQIVPSGSVSFDFTFKRVTSEPAEASQTEPLSNTAATANQSVETTTASVAPASVALETAGFFSLEECEGRFDILSQTRAINFAFGSSELDDNSFPVLNTLIDIINRCPDLNVIVAGHTDSSGSEEANMILSTARAKSVSDYLTGNGVFKNRIFSMGLGETQPMVPNDTRRNRARNRRIEFLID